MSLPRRRVLGILGVTGAASIVGAGAAAATEPGTLAGTFTDADGNITDLSGEVSLSGSSGQVDISGTVTAVPRYNVYAGETVVAGLTRVTQGWTVDSLTVPAGAVLEFAPDASVTVQSRGNVIVEGTLRMRPDTAAQTHTLRFIDVNEAAYVGGGMTPLASDVGLWVTGGTLDVCGQDKTAWLRAVGSLDAGALSIALESAPVGWLPGDEVVVVPTGFVTDSLHYDRYDTRTVESVSGSTVTLTAPLSYAHPAHTDPRTGRVYAAEVLNVTRNARLEGTATGRAHVMVTMGPAGQMPMLDLCHAAIRHMGPQQIDSGGNLIDNLGRYGIHLHMCENALAGTVVEGVVVRDCGSHAFVTHETNGVTWRDCISHDTFADAYWWDTRAAIGDPDPMSDDVAYERCVASRIRMIPSFRGSRLTGFNLLPGTGNRAVDCVAVGVQGTKDASGFLWPEVGTEVAIWEVSGLVAHNNKRHGIFTWQNGSGLHVISDFTCHRNGGNGVSHGAYRNNYVYERFACVENGASPFLMHAVSDGGVRLALRDARLDANGQPQALELTKHTLATAAATVCERVAFTSYIMAGVRQTYVNGSNGQSKPDLVDLIDCSFDAGLPHVDIAQALPGSLVREIEGGVVVATWPR